MKGIKFIMNIAKNAHRIIFVIVFFIGFIGCGYADAKDKKVIEGTIYLGGQIFGKVNLESKKWEAVYIGPDRIYCEYPNVVNKNLFILETKGSQIEYFDVLSNKFTFIAKGIKPVYIPEINSIFYYKDKEGLFQKVLGENKEEKFVTNNVHAVAPSIQPNVLYYPNPPIKISSEEIVYYSRDKKIEVYNYINKTFRILDVVGYKPYVFYSNKNSIVCINNADNNFYFLNVNTLKKEKIFIKNSNLVESGVVVIDDYNCLAYSKFRGGPFFWESEYKDTYIYWVSGQKEEKFIKNDDISYGVYVKE